MEYEPETVEFTRETIKKGKKKFFKKSVEIGVDHMYNVEACVRRRSGKLPCYRRISTENCPHIDRGRGDSLDFLL